MIEGNLITFPDLDLVDEQISIVVERRHSDLPGFVDDHEVEHLLELIFRHPGSQV